MRRLLIILAICFSTNTIAEESVAMCDLFKAKAELASSILSSPYVYGASNESNTASLGIAYSLSGRSKGNITKEIAETKCSLLANTSLLDEQQKWAIISIQKAGAKSELSELIKHRASILETLNFTKEQLDAKAVTLNEYNNIRQIQLAVEYKIIGLRTILAEPSQPVDISSIKTLLDKARSLDGKVAELEAKLNADNAWDVTFSAGAQKELAGNDNSGVSPFLGLAFKWSFGAYGIGDNISKIRNKAESAFSSNPNGYVVVSKLLFSKVEELLKVENIKETTLVNSITELEKIVTPLKGIDSMLAISSRKILEIQILIQKAELIGVQSRISKYMELISKAQ